MTDDERTHAGKSMGRIEYDHFLARFDKIDRALEIITTRDDRSFAAYAMARTALTMRSTWAPYAFSLLLAFATALIVIACSR